MTSEHKGRRPLVMVALASIAMVSFGLAIPIGGGSDSQRVLQGVAVEAAAGERIALNSPLTLLEAPRLVLEEGTVSVPAGLGQKSSAGRALYRLLTGGGADLALDGATLTLHQSSAPKDSVVDSGDASVGVETLEPIASALARLDFRTVIVRNGTIIIKGDGGNAKTVLRDVNARVTSDRKASLEAKGTLRLRGEELSFDIALARPDGKADTSLTIRASVTGDLVKATIEGYLVPDRLQLTADKAALTILKLRETARWLGVPWPQDHGPVAFQATGTMEWNEGTISFANAHFAVDGNAAGGSLSLRLAADHPAVEGTLAFDTLNLAPYVSAKAAPTKRAVVTSGLPFVRMPAGLSPSLIREFDADLRISAGTVATTDVVLRRCAISISIKDGKLLADLAEIELGNGGTGDGQFAADVAGATPRYTLRGKLEDLDMGRALGTPLGPPVVEGLGTFVVDLSGEGNSGEEILASLSGDIEIDMPEGARLGVDIIGLEKAARTAPRDQGWDAIPEGATDVGSLTARLSAAAGKFTARAVEANAGDTVIRAGGTINAVDRTLDVTVVLSGGLAQDRRPDAAEPSPTAAFSVRGPWTAPRIGAATGAEKVGLFTGQ